MLEYTELKRNRRRFLALTGLIPKEFQALLPFFVEAYSHTYEGDKTVAGQQRQRQRGGGSCRHARDTCAEVALHLGLSENLPTASGHG